MRDLSPGEPIEFGEVTLIPLEEREIRCQARNGMFWCYALKRPAGLLISTPRGETTIDLLAQ